MALRDTQDILVVEVDSVGAGNIRVSQDVLVFEIDAPTSMSLTYPLTPPAISGIGPQTLKFTMMDLVGETVSPFTGGQQVQQWPGQWFEFEATMPRMTRAQAEQWNAFLAGLHGKLGTFLFGDPLSPAPQGVATGTPLVNGSNLNGASQLNTKGWTHSVAGILKAGDYIQVTASGQPQRLHKLVQDAASDGSGNSTLQIFPSIRESLSDGTTIVLANTAGTFRLSENARIWQEEKDKTYSISFKGKEAI
jgi:hypothetical protein